MSSIIGIPTTRLSNLFVSQRLLSQLRDGQMALFRAETQMSTGHRFQLPSEDPQSALRAMGLQQLLARKVQIKSNVEQNQAYLNVTDQAMATTTNMITELRSVALGVIGSTATDQQRQAAANQVKEALRQLVATGNMKYRGRYLFAGGNTGVSPFSSLGDNYVRYDGDEQHVQTYGDLALLLDTNFNGAQTFGALSDPVRGTATLTPALSDLTRLSDLNGGAGISSGSIELVTNIGPSTYRATVDLSKAQTLGDVARMIQAGAPSATPLNVEITSSGLRISMTTPGGNLVIRNSGGGSTASSLGILQTTGDWSGTVNGTPLKPLLRDTTLLADLLGSRSQVTLRSDGTDNDLIFEASANGTTLNGVTVNMVNDPAVTTTGSEYATFAGGVITVHMNETFSTAAAVKTAANRDLAGFGIQARLDPLDDLHGGVGRVTPAGGAFQGGSGRNLDQTSGLQIVNGGQTYTVDFSDCTTVQDLLNKLNLCGAGLLAQINAAGTGIDVRSRLSGCDFAIGENGGTTATDLGLRSLTTSSLLEDFNHGGGVHDSQIPPQYAQATFQFSAASSSLIFTAVDGGTASNGYTIDFVNSGGASGSEGVSIVGNQITVSVVPGVTTANTVVELFNSASGVSGLFRAALDTNAEPANTGNGAVGLGSQVTSGGTVGDADFTITTVAGDTFSVDINGCTTLGNVIDTINAAAQGTTLRARTATYGNGIELYDTHAGVTAGNITVNQVNFSQAAIDLGLIPAGQTSNSTTVQGVCATATTAFADPNANVTFTAPSSDPAYNGTRVVYSTAAPPNPGDTVAYDPAQAQLTFYVDGSTTTAADIKANLEASPYATLFRADLVGDGSAVVADTTATPAILAGGRAETLTGTDRNPQEVDSVFTALSRLYQALTVNDTGEIERAIKLLDSSSTRVSYCRVELGVQQQGLDVLTARQEDENIQLQSSLSVEYDADFTEAATEFSARQLAYQAALKTSGTIAQMTLLDYL